MIFTWAAKKKAGKEAEAPPKKELAKKRENSRSLAKKDYLCTSLQLNIHIIKKHRNEKT
jgi:hypothetical protein